MSAKLSNTLWPIIELIDPDRVGDVMRWFRDIGYALPDNNGKLVYFERSSFELIKECAADLGRYVWECYCRRPQSDATSQTSGATSQTGDATSQFCAPSLKPPADFVPKPEAKTDAKRDEAREQYDDDTLAGMVLEFLRQNRRGEYTYNQVADTETIRCHFKDASRALRRLADRGPDVVMFATQGAKDKRVKVWKYAPERKSLDRDYSRAQELVGGAIISYLTAKPFASTNAICAAMRLFFGYIDDHCVRNVVAKLVETGRLVRTPGPRRANLHSLP